MAGHANVVTLRLDAGLRDLIDARAANLGWTRAQVCRYAIRRALDENMTPEENGAREGFYAAIHEFTKALQETWTRAQYRLNLEPQQSQK